MKHIFYILFFILGVSNNIEAQSIVRAMLINDNNGNYVVEDTKTGLYGLKDKNDKQVLPCKYSWIQTYLNESVNVVRTSEGLHGMYDTKSRIIYDEKYANFLSPSFGSVVELNIGGKTTSDTYFHIEGGKWGVGDLKGNIIVPVAYDCIVEIRKLENNLYIEVSNGGHFDRVSEQYVDGETFGLYLNGKMVVPCEYDTIDFAGDDIYMVRKNGKWGYYGNGRELITPQYDAVSHFTDDVAAVRKDGEVRLIKNPLKDASEIQIAEGGSSVNNKKQRGAVVSRYPKPESDVDKNIPVAQKQAENTFAFIICNENYADAPVPYSLNDGRMFKEYCQKSLGLPEKNINMYEDATFGNIITAIEKMKSIADAYDGEASVIFYYAGHGFPDDKQQTAYLLPIDGDASSITTTGYPLAKLYKEIAGLNLKSSIVFLDACFSGAKREDQMLASSRGVAIKVKEEAPQGKMVVFSAAQGDETAHQLEDMHHGLFTYYLLKGIQNAGGDPDMGTLTEYVTKQVKRQSVVINNKKQTPTVIPSQSLSGTWQTMKLR